MIFATGGIGVSTRMLRLNQHMCSSLVERVDDANVFGKRDRFVELTSDEGVGAKQDSALTDNITQAYDDTVRPSVSLIPLDDCVVDGLENSSQVLSGGFL